MRHRKPENWLAAVARRGDGLQSEDALSPAEQAREALLMGLRLAEGIVPDALAARFGLPVEALLNARQVRLLTTAGLMEGRNARLRVTPQGMLLLDSILAAIVEV